MSPDAPAPPPRPCPICGQPATPTYRPFCSRRCADVDLNRWLTGIYAIPVVESPATPDEGSESGVDGR